MLRLPNSQQGFTLIELILALAVFSFMLLIIIGGFLNIVRLYQAGLVSRDTQDNARYGMEQMIRAARSQAIVESDPVADPDDICLFSNNAGASSVRFYIDSSTHALTQVNLTNPLPSPGGVLCQAEPIDATTTQVLSSNNLAVVSLVGTAIPPSGAGVYQSLEITLKVASRPSLLINSNSQCQPSQPFCSLTVLTSTVTLRGTP